QPADATAEIQRIAFRDVAAQMAGKGVQDVGDMAFAAGEEFAQGALVEIAGTKALGAEHAEIGIAAPELPPGFVGIVDQTEFAAERSLSAGSRFRPHGGFPGRAAGAI